MANRGRNSNGEAAEVPKDLDARSRLAPLLPLVRLLARQAARETLSALPTSETSNDDKTA